MCGEQLETDLPHLSRKEWPLIREICKKAGIKQEITDSTVRNKFYRTIGPIISVCPSVKRNRYRRRCEPLVECEKKVVRRAQFFIEKFKSGEDQEKLKNWLGLAG